MRYNKVVFWPHWANGLIDHFITTRRGFPLYLTEHAAEKLEDKKTYKKIKNEILDYIEGVYLEYSKVFEFYLDENGNIKKICHRSSLNELYDIILVVSDECRVVTVYLNRNSYVHPNLDHNLYTRKE